VRPEAPVSGKAQQGAGLPKIDLRARVRDVF